MPASVQILAYTVVLLCLCRRKLDIQYQLLMKMFKFFPPMFVLYLVGFCFTHMVRFGASFSVYESKMETYIVQLKKPEAEKVVDFESLYGSFVPRHRIVHSYHPVMHGFAARLTAMEAEEMEDKEGVVSIRPQRIFNLQTTHTPTFLGLQWPEGTPRLWKETKHGAGVIIAVIDTGITPHHLSFKDENMDRPPEKWKGECNFNFCNNKVIGARNMINETEIPVDEIGHGTHTASTAAGNFVENVSFFRAANGTAAGMAPYAHLAIYKVCSLLGCDESAVIAGIVAAINDGADVISLSLGAGPIPFYKDAMEWAAYAAVKNGIFVSCAAGNDGPEPATVTNSSPWILTVGASTVNRKFLAIVVLGNSERFVGESFRQPTNFDSSLRDVVFPGMDGDEERAHCLDDSLTDTNVEGKIVLCETSEKNAQRVAKGLEVKRVNGSAMILVNSKKRENRILYDEAHVLPASHVSYTDGEKIKGYITESLNSQPKVQPQATILFKGTVFVKRDAPMVAEFSSRGPNLQSPGILKPDILGPGVNILAAWPNQDNSKNIQDTFNMISGTSMATPHLSGIVALLISSHRDWTPAMIKSALITTAYTRNIAGGPIKDVNYNEASWFDMGAGHVDPSRANDPGLVYDIDTQQEINYLCGLGYSTEAIETIVNEVVSCSNRHRMLDSQLNYPSFSIGLGSDPTTVTVDRTVTNVGPKNATYTLRVVAPPGVEMRVSPKKLIFREGIDKVRYSVTFDRLRDAESGSTVQGHLRWVYDEYIVRSPIVVEFV